jgi:hypothetical protein
MVFIMPALLSAKHYLLLWFSLLFYTAAYADDTFQVTSAKVSKIGNGYTLNAQIEYPLTPRVVEALDHGVPINFQQQIRLVRSIPILGKYWQWQSERWQTTLTYQLRYHALSKQYILVSMDTRKQLNFPSLASALSELGKIQNFNLPPEHLTDTLVTALQLRSGIDLHALPTPMRPGALISSKWQLTSPWVTAEWP